jgi:hypothetical protein
VLDVVLEGVAQLARVLFGQVDLIRQSVEAEFDGLVGLRLVKVIDEMRYRLIDEHADEHGDVAADLIGPRL